VASGEAASNLPGFPAPDPQLAALVAQAGLVLLASGLRSWTRSAEIWTRLLPAIERSMTGAIADPVRQTEARAALIDEIRASVRGMSELAAGEARRVQEEIDDVLRRLWPGPAADPPEGYRRRWAVKP
jgi:hypothetical protein